MAKDVEAGNSRLRKDVIVNMTPESGGMQLFPTRQDSERRLSRIIGGRHVMFVSFRLDERQLDGVSLEVNEWANALNRVGAHVHFFSGHNLKPDFLRDDVSFEYPSCNFTSDRPREFTESLFRGGDLTRDELLVLTGEKPLESLENPSKAVRMMEESKQDIKRHLKKSIESTGTEYVIAENVLSYPGNLALSLALVEVANETGLKVLNHSHDFWFEREKFRTGDRVNLESLLEHMANGIRKQSVAVINKTQYDEAMKRGAKDVTVIPNIRDFEKPLLTNPQKVGEFRSLFCSPEKEGGENADILLVAPVRPIRRKNIELSVRLARDLKEKLAKERVERDVKLLVTHPPDDEGDDYLKEIMGLGEKLGVEVRSSGEQIKKGDYDLDTAYAASDMVVYTTRLEGFGNVIPEAMRACKPFVVYPYWEYQTEVRPTGVQCIQVPVEGGDSKVTEDGRAATAEAMYKVLVENPQLKSRMTELNQSIGLRMFSYASLEKKLVGVFTRMENSGGES